MTVVEGDTLLAQVRNLIRQHGEEEIAKRSGVCQAFIHAFLHQSFALYVYEVDSICKCVNAKLVVQTVEESL